MDPIIIENGTFAWEADTITLRDINLRIKDGSLVAIVGTVGAGKSSLLAAMLGELERLNGKVNTKVSSIKINTNCAMRIIIKCVKCVF